MDSGVPCPHCRRGLLQTVAKAAHGEDAHAARLDLFAQPVHVDFDRVIADLFAPFAQMIDQLFFRHQPADPLQQHFEQAQFACR